MSHLREVPTWVKFILTLIGIVVSVTLAYANLRGDIQLLQQKDQTIEQGVAEIKQMLREEIDRHHPRK